MAYDIHDVGPPCSTGHRALGRRSNRRRSLRRHRLPPRYRDGVRPGRFRRALAAVRSRSRAVFGRLGRNRRSGEDGGRRRRCAGGSPATSGSRASVSRGADALPRRRGVAGRRGRHPARTGRFRSGVPARSSSDRLEDGLDVVGGDSREAGTISNGHRHRSAACRPHRLRRECRPATRVCTHGGRHHWSRSDTVVRALGVDTRQGSWGESVRRGSGRKSAPRWLPICTIRCCRRWR